MFFREALEKCFFEKKKKRHFKNFKIFLKYLGVFPNTFNFVNFTKNKFLDFFLKRFSEILLETTFWTILSKQLSGK